jgi:hypothetical protein
MLRAWIRISAALACRDWYACEIFEAGWITRWQAECGDCLPVLFSNRISKRLRQEVPPAAAYMKSAL